MPHHHPRSQDESDRRNRPWVVAGGSILAGVAGYVNVCVLGFFTVPVSHMTGAVSRLSIDLQRGDVAHLMLIAAIVAGFLLGAIISGVIIGSGHLRPGRRYGITLVIEGVLLACATGLLMMSYGAGVVVAATACGVQNAMASSYFGLVVRTTHVTGIVTDLGVMIGHWVRHRRVRVWKLLMLTSLLLSFFSGGVTAAAATARLGMAALAIPSAGCLVAGAGYYSWRHHRPGTRRKRQTAIAASA